MPWSTANEDLVELFETTGQVELAEILFEGTRSKGMGIVQFAQVQEAETAIGASLYLRNVRRVRLIRFRVTSQVPRLCLWWTSFGFVHFLSALLYLPNYDHYLTDVRFNDRWHTFTPTAAKGGSVMPMQQEA